MPAADPSAIDLTNNRSVALTASAAQIRRPIYGSSDERNAFRGWVA